MPVPTDSSPARRPVEAKGPSEPDAERAAPGSRFNMLPKSTRIPRKLFGLLLEEKRFYTSPHFSLRVARGPRVQIAVSVPKKVSKSAVTRNTVRRRAYSAIRPLISTLTPSFYLVIARSGADKIKGIAISQELANLLKKANM